MMTPMNGTRLSFVVVPLEGTVKRAVTRFVKGEGIVTELVTQQAGYMVYFPRGHAIRLKDERSLAKYGLDRKPSIINMQGLHDPTSPIGKLMTAQDKDEREGAYSDLEDAVIKMATAMTGPRLMPEQFEAEEREAA